MKGFYERVLPRSPGMLVCCRASPCFLLPRLQNSRFQTFSVLILTVARVRKKYDFFAVYLLPELNEFNIHMGRKRR